MCPINGNRIGSALDQRGDLLAEGALQLICCGVAQGIEEVPERSHITENKAVRPDRRPRERGRHPVPVRDLISEPVAERVPPKVFVVIRRQPACL